MSKTRRQERDHPAPIVGIEAAYDRLSDALSRRSDRFSQLLSRAVRNERRGDVLMTTSGLMRQEHEELARLTPAAHDDPGVELTATIDRLLADLEPPCPPARAGQQSCPVACVDLT